MKIFKSLSFKKLLYNKQFTITISILLAFACWIILTINQKPTIERVFTDLTINVNLENTFAAENQMSIIGDISTQKFTVTVRGSNAVVGSLTSNDLNLYASAASVDAPGSYSLDVASMGNSTDYEILSITPPVLEVNFDYVDTREYTIEALAQGAVAETGLIAEGGIVSGTESDTITISGPRTVLNRIETVAAVAKVNKTLSVSETFDADIILYDSEGRIVEKDNLSLGIEKVKVTVPISKKKSVPVKLAFANAPTSFSATSIPYKLDYATVVIIGKPETINKTKEITLSPIDLKKITKSSYSFDVSAKLPEGVRLLDSIDHFTVSFDLKGYTEKNITVKSLKYTGLSKNLKTEGGTAINNVKIFGPSSVIDNFDESKAYAEINLSDKKAGEHTVTVSINFKDYKNVWAMGTYKTTVVVK